MPLCQRIKRLEVQSTLTASKCITCIVVVKDAGFDSTEFADRCPEQAKKNAALLLAFFNASEEAGAGSHWKGIRNSFRRDDDVMTMEKCLFIQATTHQAFFDFIGKDGFDMRNVKPGEVEALMRVLPKGWAIVKDVSLHIFIMLTYVCLSFLLLSPCHSHTHNIPTEIPKQIILS